MTAVANPKTVQLPAGAIRIPRAASGSKQNNHTYEEMIIQAVRSLNEPTGSSVQSIKKFMLNNFSVSTLRATNNVYFKRGLEAALKNKRLKRLTGQGLTGSFKLRQMRKTENKSPPVEPPADVPKRTYQQRNVTANNVNKVAAKNVADPKVTRKALPMERVPAKTEVVKPKKITATRPIETTNLEAAEPTKFATTMTKAARSNTTENARTQMAIETPKDHVAVPTKIRPVEQVMVSARTRAWVQMLQSNQTGDKDAAPSTIDHRTLSTLLSSPIDSSEDEDDIQGEDADSTFNESAVSGPIPRFESKVLNLNLNSNANQTEDEEYGSEDESSDYEDSDDEGSYSNGNTSAQLSYVEELPLEGIKIEGDETEHYQHQIGAFEAASAEQDLMEALRIKTERLSTDNNAEAE